MNTFWWIITIYFVGIFLVGLPMAKKSIKVWFKLTEKNICGSGGVWGLMLFPLSSIGHNVGSSSFFSRDIFIGRAAYNNNKQKYVLISPFFWPTRVAWTIIALAVSGVCWFIWNFCKVFCNLLSWVYKVPNIPK